MSKGKTSDARKKKYAAQFDKTKRNKEKHISILKKLNPFWPSKKPKEKK